MTSTILSDYNLFNDWLDASSLVVDSPPALSSSGSSQSDFYPHHLAAPHQEFAVDPNFNFRYYTPLELDISYPTFSTNLPNISNHAQLQQNRHLFTSTPTPFVAPSSPNFGTSDRLLSPLYRSSVSPPAPAVLLDHQPQRSALKDITNFFPEHCRPYSPQLPPFPMVNNVSPIIHASAESALISVASAYPPFNPQNTGPKFLERIEQIRVSVPEVSSAASSPERPLAENYPPNLGPPLPSLGSPCKRLYNTPSKRKANSALLSSPFSALSASKRTTSTPLETPNYGSTQITSASPLTPLTPLSDSSGFPSPLRRKARSTAKKQKLGLRIASSGRRQSTRLRTRVSCSQVTEEPSDHPLSSLSSLENNDEQSSTQTEDDEVSSEPIFTTRVFSSQIEVSSEFPMYYRRFPVSSYPDLASGDRRHPGGNYNPPRFSLDLYTPRFVKGRGTDKVGLCPVCCEPPARGGSGKKIWLAMKFSAFNYHMQYSHGISAATGRPFSPPIAFRRVKRSNPGKKERAELQEGKCHKCAKWVPIEGIKAIESKVKEIFWWKHAATCHQHSVIESENDVYEKDDVYHKLIGN